MPHIYIKEKDNTTSTAESDYNVVYVPIASGEGGDTVDLPASPLLTVSELDEYVGTHIGAKTANIGYVYAKGLISLGLPVLPEIVNSAGEIDYGKLTDKGLYSIKYLTAGGLEVAVSDTSATGTMANMLAAAAKRGDCIALLDHKKDIETEASKTYADAVRTALGLGDNGALASDGNLSFGAAFSPWCTISGMKMPPSFAFLSAYASSVASNPNWYASAGKERGKIPGITAVEHSYGDVECNLLQARKIDDKGAFASGDNQGIAINPITYIRAFGNYVVWGNRTLLKNGKSGLTASSFLNIRNLCCDVKKELYAAAREFTFEQNGDILWVNFSARIRPLLDRALSGNGIRGYKLIKESSNKKGRLTAKIKIVPIEAVEDFDLTLELEDSIETVSESGN